MEIRHHQFDRLAVACAPLNQDAGRLAEWGTWLDRLWGNVYDLLISRQGFREAAEALIKAEASALARATLGISFQFFIAIKLRCQLDPDERSVSVARLLTNMLEHTPVLCRDLFLSRYRGRWENRTLPTGEKIALGLKPGRGDLLRWSDEGNLRYDELVGPGQQKLTQEVLRSDLRVLEQSAEKISRFANKSVAHNDVRGPSFAPSGDLDEEWSAFIDSSGGSADEWLAFLGVDPCTEILRSLLVKYWWLVKGSRPLEFKIPVTSPRGVESP